MSHSIRCALLSVSDKTGIVPFAEGLAAAGVALISTGGTAAALRAAGLTVTDAAEVTGYPEMLDGRVKTLHPHLHGGLLARRDRDDHMAALEAQGIAPIDLLAVNLYPFQATVAAGADADACIENIDIGGPALIRAAAKNHGAATGGVSVVVEPGDYDGILASLSAGGPDPAMRRGLAAKAYAHTAAYDAMVAGWFADEAGEAFPERLTLAPRRAAALRYGENPHQAAAFYAMAPARPGVATAELKQGKPLSYNNLNDADAAFELAGELARFGEPACVIVKHANPSGAARGVSLSDAYARARACDPVSAFGGVIAVTEPLDQATAEAVTEIFTEVVIAPGADAAAIEVFAKKPNLRLLLSDALPDPAVPGRAIRSVSGGLLVQDRDARIVTAADLTVVTKRAPSEAEIADLLFAWSVAKHVKSNAIVYAKDGVTVGVGAGQMSRVDSTRVAAGKAAEMAAAAGASESAAVGSVVASDAFFPFPDGLITAAEAGATALIQPGGAQRDAEVIAAADARGLAMVFTGVRHFRH